MDAARLPCRRPPLGAASSASGNLLLFSHASVYVSHLWTTVSSSQPGRKCSKPKWKNSPVVSIATPLHLEYCQDADRRKGQRNGRTDDAACHS
uniref:Secreted protein n=1 Tax=Setaria digitata TaxID=48799 RepID=A0A915Q5S1_9BILA